MIVELRVEIEVPDEPQTDEETEAIFDKISAGADRLSDLGSLLEVEIQTKGKEN